ncbi:MAG: MGMT family protein [Planctomycetota bacterium]
MSDPRRVVGPGFHARVYDIVMRVPFGSVSTYGDVAEALGSRTVARHVGNALAALPDRSDVPWHRIVSSRGRLSFRSDGGISPEQVIRLKAEGVDVDFAGRIQDFARVRWPGGAANGDRPADSGDSSTPP